MEQTFQLFSECVLFRHLQRRDIEALFARVRIRDFAAGETIFVIGSAADSLMIVLRGTVEVPVASPNGQPLPILLNQSESPSIAGIGRGRIAPGEIFGEIALLEGSARLADAIAITDCCVAMVDRHDMLAFLEQNPDAWQDFVSVFSKRLRRMPDGREGRQQYADLTEIALRHEARARMS